MRWNRLAVLPAAVLVASCFGGDPTSPLNQILAAYLLNYCSTPPAFVAIQQEAGGAWTPVTLANGQATVQLGDKFGLAVVRQNGTSWSTYIYYLTKTELPSASATCPVTTGSKTINGSVSTLPSGQEAQVTMDGRHAFLVSGGTTALALSGVRDGAKDAIAQRRTTSTGLADKVIIRRAQDVTGGATMSQFNFAAVEAATPASGAITIAGVSASELRDTYTYLYTTGGLTSFFNSPLATNTAGTAYGLPAASVAASDRHVISLNVHNNDYSATHGVDVFQNAIANLTVTAGPALSTPVVTVVSTSPRRLRLQLASQSDYSKIADFYYWNYSGNVYHDMSVIVSATYLGSTPATWDLQPPVLTAVSGYPAAADMPNATAMWSTQAVGATDWYFHSATDVPAGTVIKWAWQESAVAVGAAPGMLAGNLRQPQNLQERRSRVLQELRMSLR